MGSSKKKGAKNRQSKSMTEGLRELEKPLKRFEGGYDELTNPSSELVKDSSDFPDPNSEDYIRGSIDKFHAKEEEKIFKSKNGQISYTHTSQAAYDLPDSEDEQEMEDRLRKVEWQLRRYQKRDDDDEDDEGSDGDKVKLQKAWGKSRGSFYGSDVQAKVLLHKKNEGREMDNAREILEEQEAILLQQQLANQIDEADFGLDYFAAPESKELVEKKKSKKSEELITSDLSQLSLKQKRTLLTRKYPEFMNIVTDYKASLVEYRDRLAPIIQLNSEGKIPDSDALSLIKQKAQILLSYCCCCQFYLLLRAENAKVEGHPVIKRMTQMKQLLKELSNAQEQFEAEINYILEMVAQGKVSEIRVKRNVPTPTVTSDTTDPLLLELEALVVPKPVEAPSVTLKKRSSKNASKRSLLASRDPELIGDTNSSDMITEAEREAYEFYRSIKDDRGWNKKTKLEEAVESGNVESGQKTEGCGEGDTQGDKRGATSQMMRNKGLTAYKKKQNKTSRMKNKSKYEKKMSIYKTIVPKAQKEMTRYSGEVGGIRGGNIRSVTITR